MGPVGRRFSAEFADSQFPAQGTEVRPRGQGRLNDGFGQPEFQQLLPQTLRSLTPASPRSNEMLCETGVVKQMPFDKVSQYGIDGAAIESARLQLTPGLTRRVLAARQHRDQRGLNLAGIRWIASLFF